MNLPNVRTQLIIGRFATYPGYYLTGHTDAAGSASPTVART